MHRAIANDLYWSMLGADNVDSSPTLRFLERRAVCLHVHPQMDQHTLLFCGTGYDKRKTGGHSQCKESSYEVF